MEFAKSQLSISIINSVPHLKRMLNLLLLILCHNNTFICTSNSCPVTFDVAPDTTRIDYVQPMEAINYFVEMETEKHLERMRMAAEMEQTGQGDDATRNTVLVLPKIRRLVS